MLAEFNDTADITDIFPLAQLPTVFLHIGEQYSDGGILMAASSNAQAKKVSELINDCELIELTGNHDIHRFQPEAFISALERIQKR